VAAQYSDTEFRIHYEFETDSPSWYHQVWRRENGEWVRYGAGAGGPDEHGLYEDRISMLLDDGSVDGFSRYGGWMTAHEGMRTLDSAVPADAVREHPVLGEEMGRTDVRKYLNATREVDDEAEVSWDRIREDAEIEAMRDRGEFLDLWQWRAHRSHPIGYADNNYVLQYRLNSAGRGMFVDNWDAEAGQPAYMFDPDEVGRVAIEWDALVAGEFGQDDPYFIHEGNAVAYDPDHDWQDGDVIPQRFLREPDGARGAIRAEGGHSDGAWRITLIRSLEAPDPRDSKALEDGGIFNVAFAVHSGAVGARWHLVSLPETLALGVEGGTITARHFAEPAEPEELEWTELQLIYPGQITWQWLNSADHPGQPQIVEGELGVQDFHLKDQLNAFILGHERALKELDDRAAAE
jgi:hypothetical protein